ncbi:MAG: SPOR domain-containing protein [Pseudorhizobium sp.]
MADNNLARNRNDRPDFFADDDPLAELARIVGYDERLVPKLPAADRREPAFNLEDELLQEFERYEAPRPHHSLVAPADHAAPVVSAPSLDDAVVAPDEQVYAAVDSPADDAPSDVVVPYDEPSVEVASASSLEPSFGVDHAFDDTPSFELEAGEEEAPLPAVELGTQHLDAQMEPAAFEGSVEPSEEPSVAIDPQDETVSTHADPSVEMVPEASRAEPSFDLSDEVELSIGATETLDARAQDERMRMGRKPIYTPGFRMPLANFNAQSERPRTAVPNSAFGSRTEPSMDLSPPFEQGTAVVEPETSSEAVLVEAPQEPVVSHVPETFVAAAEPSFADQVDVVAVDDGYSVSEVAGDDDGAFALSGDDRRHSAPVISEPRWDMPFDLRDDGFSARVPLPASRPADVAAQTAHVDPMHDDDFELALDDLELDLTEMFSDEELQVFDEPTPAAPAAPVAMAAPAPVEPQRFTATWSPVARVVPAAAAPVSTVYAAAAAAPIPPVAVAQPVEPIAQVPDAGPALDAASSLAFDPSLISENVEQPEPVFDLNVPDLQVEEHEPAPVFRNDYDYDIDAELASLLQPMAAEASEASDPVEVTPAEQPQRSAAPASYLDLDDFERALEEDFRRSLTTPLPPQAGMEEVSARTRLPIPEIARRPMSAYAVPLAIAGVVIAGSSIAYALFGGDGGSVASNGEPMVIAADTTPVKVLPANPGGKTVPNQDKAVYDRVAGEVPAAPMQEALISSSEEPVDVVQKTLMTDQLPLEGEGNAEFADATADSPYREDRLMPDLQQAELPADTSQSVAVMPRRVKTMIVRPDGTLVEQEVAAPAEPTVPSALPVETQKVAAASVRSVETASVPDASISANAAAVDQAPASGIVPVSAEVSSDLTAAAATAGIPLEAPVADQPSIAAPVPMARPARQPANVVAAVSNQGTVSAAPAAPAAAPQTQVASVAPGGYVIQIASLPSAADAERSYNNLSSKFASVIGGRGVDIRAAEIAGKGTFYRVRIPAGSKEDAVRLCESYRAAGGSCLVAK